MSHPAFNPYLPGYEYIPDAEPRVFGNRLYIYGSHDCFNGEDFCVLDYVCWSAPLQDLGDWRFEGTIYRAVQDPKNADGSGHLFAPDCVQGPDGRYYLYYQLHNDRGISVAVSTRPAGPFSFYSYVEQDGAPYGFRKGDACGFDPGVLVEDGRVWLYTGFAPPPGPFKELLEAGGNAAAGGYCMELELDMKTVKTPAALVLPGPELAEGTEYEGHAFYEASSPRKIDGRYYLVYSSVLSHELCYAVSLRPDGDFRYGGTIVSIGDLGYRGRREANNYTGNTHGGLAEIRGEWYIFYHRQTNLQKCARQGCAERIRILQDGSIPQVEMTSCGLNGGLLPARGTWPARIACNLSSREGTFACLETHEENRKGIHPYFTQSGEDREQEDDQYIANLTDGSWCAFRYFCLEGREKEIQVSVRGTARGTLRLFTEENRTVPCAAIPVIPSPEWGTCAGVLSAAPGTWPLVFRFEGTGSLDFRSFRIL